MKSFRSGTNDGSRVQAKTSRAPTGIFPWNECKKNCEPDNCPYILGWPKRQNVNSC